MYNNLNVVTLELLEKNSQLIKAMEQQQQIKKVVSDKGILNKIKKLFK